MCFEVMGMRGMKQSSNQVLLFARMTETKAAQLNVASRVRLETVDGGE